ncbi:helix-turn-helix domain-containing protein [Marivirga salinae]|uniref:Helix-turn-helix domain-containing protein n=1 Tax=Marivirga salinarum TaxID=3059078 RepID=A0AA51NAI2_9BACT|nr:helix-turn-helix domain-containing protein [Marivirga sp. BDSF4-3]WMN11454.1 helix-turn-helix domain-containing protein [Marivirga sp. BDSF4-3]
MSSPSPVLSTIILVFALQAILLSALVFFKQPKNQSNIFLSLLIFFYALMALNIAFINVLIRFDSFEIFRYFQLELLYGIGPALYFYTKSISNPNFRFKKQDYLHFLPLVLEFIFYRTAFYRLGAEGMYQSPSHTYTKIYLGEQWLGILSISIYTILAFRLLIKHQNWLKQRYSNLEKKSLNWLKLPVIFYGSFWISWNILTELDRFIFDEELRKYYFLPSFAGLAIVSCWIAFKSYTFSTPEPTEQNKKLNTKAEPSLNLEKYAKRIQHHMETEKPYLDPDLNLSQLANQLNMNSKQVSQTINTCFEKNFYEYVNEYKVKYFIQKVNASEQEKYTLLSLAYDCGFKSKSTFNDSFKKITGKTPTEYIKKLKKESESMHSVD